MKHTKAHDTFVVHDGVDRPLLLTWRGRSFLVAGLLLQPAFGEIDYGMMLRSDLNW